MPKISRKRAIKNKKKEKGNTALGVVFLVVIVGVGALAIWVATSRANVDTGGIELPNYAYRTTAVTESYIAAVRLQTLFEYIPCYCGCVDMSHLPYDHRHLRDCFYDDAGQFTQHAAGCGTCIDEATTVWSMVRDDAQPIDIRNTIDNRYSNGNYPPPTNTPMPPN